MDFVVNQTNRFERANNPSNHVRLYSQGQADDLRFDEWAYVVNARLRPAVTKYAITKDGSDVSAIIKGIAKDLEAQGAFGLLLAEGANSTKWVYLAALIFSYLDPARKLVKNNNNVQKLLDTLQAKYGFKTLDQFKEGKDASAKVSKNVGVTQSNAKIKRITTGPVLP